MPNSVKTVFVINLMLIFVLLGFGYQFYNQQVNPVVTSYITMLIIASLVVCQLLLVFKWQGLWRFVRILLYILAIVAGLMFLSSLAQFFTLVGFLQSLVALVMMLYFIGVRGFLNSKSFLEYLKQA
ncbi:MAG: hypothetical protein HWD86_10330 [Kangiellaceae bacterium]|nr:hypothetical protein [Kangiellaceae bacterium]